METKIKMKMTIAFVLNFIIPGLGNIILGHWIQGLLQVILTLISISFTLSVFLTFFGLVLFGLSWVYAFFVWFFHLKNKRELPAR
jgi:TM2 domain-containing membrane protein YozV